MITYRVEIGRFEGERRVGIFPELQEADREEILQKLDSARAISTVETRNPSTNEIFSYSEVGVTIDERDGAMAAAIAAHYIVDFCLHEDILSRWMIHQSRSLKRETYLADDLFISILPHTSSSPLHLFGQNCFDAAHAGAGGFFFSAPPYETPTIAGFSSRHVSE